MGLVYDSRGLPGVTTVRPGVAWVLHRVSFYADDVVLFLHPATEDINITMDIL
jgi:hypothetical protein